MPDGNTGYETQDVTLRPVLFAAAAILVFTVLVMVASALLQSAFRPNMAPAAGSTPAGASIRVSEPLLQVHPAADWQAVKASADSVLSTYGWVQPDSGIVHIPIEQAMALVLEEGFPVEHDTPDDMDKKNMEK